MAKSADVTAQIKNAHTQMDMDRDSAPHCCSNNGWSCVKSEKGKGNQWPLRSVTFCVRAYVCDKRRGPSRFETLSWGQINARILMTLACVCGGLGMCMCGCVRGKIALLCMCVCRWEDINELSASSHSKANWRSCQESQHEDPARG